MRHQFDQGHVPAPEEYNIEVRVDTACAELEPIVCGAGPASRNIDGGEIRWVFVGVGRPTAGEIDTSSR